MTTEQDAVPPITCSLTIGKRREQVLEWADLRGHAVAAAAIDGGVASSYPIALAGQIEDLAQRETNCCGSWLDIAHERDAELLHLRLTTKNPDGEAMIRSMSGLDG